MQTIIKSSFLVLLCCLTFTAQASTINKSSESSVDDLHIVAGKNYKLLFKLDDSIDTYNHHSQSTGLGYVKNMVKLCEKYHAKCDIDVVVHGQAFPLVVKSDSLKHKLNRGVNYDYSNVINYLVAHNVRIITSKSSLEDNKLSAADLLPNVQVADSATLFCAEKVVAGYYEIDN